MTSFLVQATHTAQQLRSGDLPVLGTPALIAFVEETCFNASSSALATGETTVGTYIQLDHLAPTAVGKTVTVHITAYTHNGKQHQFTFTVDDGDKQIARGTHTRYTVSAEKFLAKVNN